VDLQKDFYKKVENVGYLKNVLYSDTDSIYICVPTDIKNITNEQKIDLAQKISTDINKIIQEYLTTTLFPRSNISPKYNMTDFKTEVILDSIMFLPNVKKQYAYKTIAEGNKIFDPPITDYKGIQVVRSDATNLGKRLLKQCIENVILNSNVKKKDKLNHIVKIVNESHQEFLELCNNFKFEDITISSKWGKDQTVINSMKLYNFLVGSNLFLPASAGRFIYCKFSDVNKFASIDIDIKKINAISIPYTYSFDLLKQKFQEYGIRIDVEKQWERVYTTTVQRVVDLVKGI
jgi:hypothetical protein